jgi:sugar lactone lactonase YvrE
MLKHLYTQKLTKSLFTQILIVLVLLSFPLASFGATTVPNVTTSQATSVSYNEATFKGRTNTLDVSEYGFDYGLTTDYGTHVASQPVFKSYEFVYKVGATGIDSYGNTIPSSGSGDGEFSNPNGIFVDSSGNIFVTDTGNSRIQKFDSSGNFLMQIGQYGNADGTFQAPRSVGVDSSGNIYVADSNNYRVQKFDSSGNFVLKFGSYGSGDGQFASHNGIAVDSSGDVYVSDTNNSRIQKFDSSGNFILKFQNTGGTAEQLLNPLGITVSTEGFVYVVDSQNQRIVKFDSVGNYISQIGGEYSSNVGEFAYPKDVAVDSSGNVFVADTNNHRIQKFDSSGNYLTQISDTYINSYGQEQTRSGNGDGQFYNPTGVGVDSSGNVFVADTENNRIQKFTPSDPDSSEFVSPIKNLDCGTTYNFRAYSTNDVGTSYGANQTLTTTVCTDGPTELSVTPSSVTAKLNWTNPNVNDRENTQLSNIL